jgi:hypothetical protein
MDYGRFSTGDTVFVKGVRLNEDIAENVFRTVVQFVVPSNGFTLTEGYEPITNYIHEVRLNESKRRIKLISKNLVDQIIREFKALVKPL